jgi:hypothetical protein
MKVHMLEKGSKSGIPLQNCRSDAMDEAVICAVVVGSAYCGVTTVPVQSSPACSVRLSSLHISIQ